MFTMFQRSIGGFSYRHRDDEIHEFTFSAVTPLEVDAWIALTNDLKPLVVAHNHHMRSIYHLESVWPSPYAVRSATAVMKSLPRTLRNSTALLLDDHHVAVTVTQMILRQLPMQTIQARQVFYTEAEAVRWIRERERLLPDSLVDVSAAS